MRYPEGHEKYAAQQKTNPGKTLEDYRKIIGYLQNPEATKKVITSPLRTDAERAPLAVDGARRCFVLLPLEAATGYPFAPVAHSYRDDEEVFEADYNQQPTDPTYPDPVTGLSCTAIADPVTHPSGSADDGNGAPRH